MQRNVIAIGLWALTSLVLWGVTGIFLVRAEDGKDPITDALRYEIAAAQRDYLIAQQQLERANLALRTKLDTAQKACAADRDQIFALDTFHCAPK